MNWIGYDAYELLTDNVMAAVASLGEEGESSVFNVLVNTTTADYLRVLYKIPQGFCNSSSRLQVSHFTPNYLPGQKHNYPLPKERSSSWRG